MGISGQLAKTVSKVLARLHRWYATAWVLSRVPLATLDNTATGRLRYALMMSHRTAPQRTERLLHSLILRSKASSPELRIELAAMATGVDLPGLATDLFTQAQQAAENPATADAAGKLLLLNLTDADGTLQSELCSQLDRIALPATDLLTLVPVSASYLELFSLWVEQVRSHVAGCVVAMAMDDAAFTALAHQPDVAVIDLRQCFSWSGAGQLNPHSRGVLWYLRVLLLQMLVQRDYPVLVLDLDAIPVGDVKAMLSKLPEADVIAQKDHSIPMDVDREFGFVLCCGFMLWRRRTPAVLALLERFAAGTAIERDDQMALNHLLARQGILQQRREAADTCFDSAGVRFVCPPETLVSRSLNSGTVVRHFHQTGEGVPEIRNALNL